MALDMGMRFLCLLLCTASLTACATTAPSQKTAGSGLSTTTLKPGECGLFGWSTDSSRDFIFFADKKSARYAGPEGPVDLSPQGEFPSLEYLDARGDAVTLRLGQGEIMDGGMRYPKAIIVTLSTERWERVQPVAIVRSCQPN